MTEVLLSYRNYFIDLFMCEGSGRAIFKAGRMVVTSALATQQAVLYNTGMHVNELVHWCKMR